MAVVWPYVCVSLPRDAMSWSVVFLRMPWAGLWSLIVALPGHIHIFFLFVDETSEPRSVNVFFP